jgi:hypothetical protein
MLHYGNINQQRATSKFLLLGVLQRAAFEHFICRKSYRETSGYNS